MDTLFTPKQVTEIAGISLASVRNYTDKYGKWFSSQATPPSGETRRFTEADLMLCCYIAQTTQTGSNHSDIAAHLEKSGGVPAEFSQSWELPAHQQSTQTQEEEIQPQAGNALVAGEQARALWAMVEQQISIAQERERVAQERADRTQEEAIAKERELLAQLAEKERAIGELAGELRAVKEMQPKRPAWWVWLFGGEKQ